MAAVSLTEDEHPLRVKLTPVPGFTFQALWDCSRQHLAPGCTVYSDGLACFNAVTMDGCTHQPTVVAGRKPKDLPELQWINTVLGNLKTSLSWDLPCLCVLQVCVPVPGCARLSVQPALRQGHVAPAPAPRRGPLPPPTRATAACGPFVLLRCRYALLTSSVPFKEIQKTTTNDAINQQQRWFGSANSPGVLSQMPESRPFAAE